MSTRVTVLQIFKFALTALIIGLLPNPLHARDKTYIEVEINGETVGKWMEFYQHWEYNPDGKIIYWKDAALDGTISEQWYEYDRNGNEIHKKDSDGNEEWHEYDRNGNCIYEKDSDGDETWYKYDRNGNCIHIKDSDGKEWWHKYDRNGKRIHTKYSDGDEARYEYDKHGNMTRRIQKSKDGEINEIIVYLLEYYRGSTTLKTKTVYRYEQENG